MGTPLFLQIEPTTYCNLKCLSCQNPLLKEKHHMTLEQFKRILNQFPYLRKLNLVGLGEPLLNPNFESFLDECGKKEIAVGLASNGMLLTEERTLSLLNHNLQWINISIDSADEERFARLRPGASLKTIIDHYGFFIKEKKKRGRNIETGIAVVLAKYNMDELEKIIHIAIELKVDKIFIQTLHNWGKNDFRKKFKDKKLEHGDNTFHEKILSAKRKAEDAGIRFLLENTPDPQSGRSCKWPWKTAYVTVQGYVTPCCMQGADPNTINFGNLFEEDFADIWNNKEYREFRRSLKSPHPPAICADCPSYRKTIQI